MSDARYNLNLRSGSAAEECEKGDANLKPPFSVTAAAAAISFCVQRLSSKRQVENAKRAQNSCILISSVSASLSLSHRTAQYPICLCAKNESKAPFSARADTHSSQIGTDAGQGQQIVGK
jgi:hypothetical protein